jgi:hypothetical protein
MLFWLESVSWLQYYQIHSVAEDECAALLWMVGAYCILLRGTDAEQSGVKPFTHWWKSQNEC